MLPRISVLLVATLVALALPALGQGPILSGTPVAPNDRRDDAIGLPSGSISIVGSNVGSSFGPEDLYSCSPDEGSSVWFRIEITTDANGLFTVDTKGSAFDTVLRLYGTPEEFPAGFNLCDDNSGGSGSSEISYSITPSYVGKHLYVSVGGANNAEGVFRLSVNFNPTSLQPLGLCLPYNPSALTNACLAGSAVVVTVPVPGVSTTSTPVCPISFTCVNVPMPGVTTTPTPVSVPVPGGYVEATALCPFAVVGPFCRVTV